MELKLRPYQEDAIESIRKNYDKGIRKQVIVLGTGLGKTVIFSHLISQLIKETGKKALIIAHREELLTQAQDKIYRIDPSLNTGIEQATLHASTKADVIIASVPTLGRKDSTRIKKFDPSAFCAVITDECHHSSSKTYKEVFKNFGILKGKEDWNKDLLLLGVTATPSRNDNKGIDEIFDKVVYNYGIIQAIEDGWLARIKAYRINTTTDLNGVKTIAGDFNIGQLAERVNNEDRNGLVVATYKNILNGKKALCFAVNVAHGEELTKRFVEEEVKAELVTGTTPKKERKKILARFETGETRVIVNIQVLTEGFDCLDKKTEVLTPTGWKGRGEIKEKDDIYSLNKITGKIEVTPVEKYIERQTAPDEKMFSIKSQHVNIRTTQGHQFHIKYRTEGKLSQTWLTKTGTELIKRKSSYALPLSASTNIPFKGLPLSNDELRLVAWFMTDGSLSRIQKIFTISQSKKYHNDIRTLLLRLKLDFKERIRDNTSGFAGEHSLPVHEFRIPKGTHSGTMKRRGWIKYFPYFDKKVSPLLHDMTRQQFLVFWEEALKGNGSRAQKNKSGWLWCPNKEQANAYTQMAVLRGLAVSCASYKTKYGKIVWRVSARKKQWITSDPSDKRSAKIKLSETKSETVWCVKNRNSTLITRRNGKVVIIGNCPSIEAILMARPTRSGILFQQMIGRGTRLDEKTGKNELIVVDFNDNTYRHTLKTIASLMGLDKSVDFKGQDILLFKEKLEKLVELSPNDDLENLDIDKIDYAIEEVDLLSGLQIPSEVVAYTSYEWHRYLKDTYRINLGNHQWIEISHDIAGEYSVSEYEFNKETHKTKSKILGGKPSLQDAVQSSDSYIAREYPDRIKLVSTTARWRRANPSDPQIDLLKKFGVTKTVLETMDKGQASRLITKMIDKNHKEKKYQRKYNPYTGGWYTKRLK